MSSPANTPGPPGPAGPGGPPGPAAPAAPGGPAGPRHGAAPPQKKGRGGKIMATLLVLGLAGGGTYAYRLYSDREPEMPGVNEVTGTAAEQQSTLVDQEDLRVMQVRAQQESDIAGGGTAAAQARDPRLMSSANGRTLMLPQRRKPYYVSDLEKLAGENFQKLSDGSYALNVNIVVASGGKLVLQSGSGPLTIRMRSQPGAFTSIVSTGGSISFNGSAQNPVNITSWDESTRSADTKVSDGRAYIRAIGGKFSMTYTHVEHLGFWSGRTGGVSLTGSDRPDSAAERAGAQGPAHKVRLPDGSHEATRGDQDQIEVRAADGSGGAASFYVPSASLVSGTIDQSTFDGNAYGIFVTASNQTRITNNKITNSLVNGVLLHRFAKNATIENTTVSRSRGDGFVLSRGTEGVRVTNCTAEENGGNGFTLNGQPLAEGASASGEATTAFGENLVSGSTAENNERYGFEILGGDNVTVQNSRAIGGTMGIVAREFATRVQISGNQVRGAERQGIVLRDGVKGGSVAGNVIHGTMTALYVRDSTATLRGNTVQSASRHGVSLLGNVSGTVLTGNTISGAGSSALDFDRAKGQYKSTSNNIKGWEKTAGFWTWVKRVAKPMNVIWAGVFLLVAVSMFRSRNAGMRIGRRGAHPYEDQTKLEERPVRLLRRAAPTAAPSQQQRQHAGARGGQ